MLYSERADEAGLAETLDGLLVGSGVGVALLDGGLRVRWLGGALATFAGRAVEDLRGRAFGELLPSVDAELAASLRELAQRGEGWLQRELELVNRASGQRRRWLARAQSVHAVAGQLVGLTLIELGERCPSDEAALLETVLQQMPSAVGIVEAPSGRTRLVNQHVVEILQRPIEAEGVADYVRFPTETAEGRRYPIEELPIVRALHGETISDQDLWYVRPSGERVQVRVSAAPVRNASGEIVAGVVIFRDVTDQVRAQNALRDSEERLRLLIEDVKDYAIFLIGADGRVASWNTGAERITGYTSHEVLGRSQAVFYPQEDVLLGRADQSLRLAHERGRAEDEGWRLRKDGTRFWASATFTALSGRCDGLRGYSVILRDNTERKLAEEALRESNRRIATTLESISDAFCAIDREWRFTYVNPGAERLLGRTRAELIGRTCAEGFPLLASSPLHGELERALRDGQKLDFETQLPASHVWFELRVYPSELGLSVYFRDVTRRRKAAIAQRILAETGKQLAESLDYEATLEQVASLAVPELADWCIAMSFEEGQPSRFTIANADATRQACARELFRRYPPLLRSMRGLHKVMETGEADLVASVDDGFLQSLSRGPEHLQKMMSCQIDSCMAVPLRARGRTLGGMAFVRARPGAPYDRDDLALAEEIGRRAALAVDNARLYQKAQTAIRAREDMVAIATHDLRGPINALKLGVQHLQLKLRAQASGAQPGGAPPVDVGAGLGRIERQIDRLGQLVEFFLEISRVIAGQIDLNLEQVDAAAVVREAVALAQEELAEAGCHVELRTSQSVIGRWDRMRLDQVVNNLLSNAIKFGRGKPIDVWVEADDDGDGRGVNIGVRDYGVGIPPDQQEKIFERFERATTGRALGGVGLGLYIVRQIAGAMGGTVSVQSEPGAGATFLVRLPGALRP